MARAKKTKTRHVEINWYEKDLALAVQGASEQTLAGLALATEGLAKVNIRENGQIDTGFMLNSVYTVAGENSGYEAAQAAALTHTHSEKTGQEVDHAGDMAPPLALPEGMAAAVVAGANYAIFQELRNSFLYRALEQVKSELGGVIQQVARDKGFEQK